MARVVLDALAVTHLGHHLDIERVRCSRRCASTSLFVLVQLLQPFLQLDLDRLDRIEHALARAGVMRTRIDRVARHLANRFAGQRIEQRQIFHVAVEQLDAQRLRFRFGRKHIDDFAAHAIRTARNSISLRCTAFGELADQLALIDALAAREDQHAATDNLPDRPGRRSPTPSRR
jgi:hypothetical protein